MVRRPSVYKEIQDLGGKLKWATMNETVNWEKIIG